MQHLSWQHLSISGISKLLLNRFWWNFKGNFLGTSRTDSNFQVDICSGNICPGDICPYQEYLSCYRLNFDQTLRVDSKKKFFLFLEPDHFTQKFCIQNLLDSKFVGPQSFLDPKFFWKWIFLTFIFLTKTFWNLILFWLKIFLDPRLLGLTWHGLFFETKIFLT